MQSGNIAADDLTQSEGMSDWVPVSQVLGNIPASAVTSGGAAVSPALERELVPLPPNWPWLVVLLLVVLTRQLFNCIWALILANWARKLSGENKAMVLVAMYPAGVVAGILTIILARDLAPLGALFILAGVIMMVVGVFSIKNAMEE